MIWLHYQAGDSKASVELELVRVQDERMSVMDGICDLLADVPTADITSLFGRLSGRIQKKLATRWGSCVCWCVQVCTRVYLCMYVWLEYRKKLMLREENLKRCLDAFITNTPSRPLNISPSVVTPCSTPVTPPPFPTSIPPHPPSPSTPPHTSVPACHPEQHRTSPILSIPPTQASSGLLDELPADEDWDFGMDEDVLIVGGTSHTPPPLDPHPDPPQYSGPSQSPQSSGTPLSSGPRTHEPLHVLEVNNPPPLLLSGVVVNLQALKFPLATCWRGGSPESHSR